MKSTIVVSVGPGQVNGTRSVGYDKPRFGAGVAWMLPVPGSRPNLLKARKIDVTAPPLLLFLIGSYY
jgi:hypothetical protein